VLRLSAARGIAIASYIIRNIIFDKSLQIWCHLSTGRQAALRDYGTLKGVKLLACLLYLRLATIRLGRFLKL
jgi:hypothetical protein